MSPSPLWTRATSAMPGGVSSPVRGFGAVGDEPLIAARGHGPYLYDTAGKRYIDYVLSWGPLILGHAHPEVVAAVSAAAADGLGFGATTEVEVELAELVIAWFPAVESVRFVNSGTEATMSALRLARGVTGRDLVLKFDGCYHGHADPFLVKAGSGVANLGLSDSPGVPEPSSRLTVSVPYNDLEAAGAALERRPQEFAAIVVEPVIGNAGLIQPREGFLVGLRRLADRHGALLLFDEVMTGFRAARGGAQERFAIMPDLTTLGKVLGAGLPVAAYGGRRELMDQIAPTGPVYQAGTLSGNPIGMAAGLAQLRVLEREDPFEWLETRTDRLVEGILERARALGVPVSGGAVGSMWGIFFAEEPVHDYAQARRTDTERFARYFRACRERGVYFAPSAFEAGFLSTAHGDVELERTLEVVGEALAAALTGCAA